MRKKVNAFTELPSKLVREESASPSIRKESAKAFNSTTSQRHTDKGRWNAKDAIRHIMRPFYEEKKRFKQSERDKRKDELERERQAKAIARGQVYLTPEERAEKRRERAEKQAARNNYGSWSTALTAGQTAQARADAKAYAVEKAKDAETALMKLYVLSGRAAGIF